MEENYKNINMKLNNAVNSQIKVNFIPEQSMKQILYLQNVNTMYLKRI